MRSCRWKGPALAAVLIAAAACSDGRAAFVPANHEVTIAWQANHEKGVNGAGGGYRVVIPGRPTVDLPHPAPTTLTTTLFTGWYAVSVEAYQRDPEFPASTLRSPPAFLTVIVP